MAGNANIFLGSGASLVMVPEHNIEFIVRTSGGAANNTNQFEPQASWQAERHFVPNIYVGCIIDVLTSAGVLKDSLIVKENSLIQITTTTSLSGYTITAGDIIRIRKYGAPSPGIRNGSTIGLNADNMMGLVETATFPQVEQEMKQMILVKTR